MESTMDVVAPRPTPTWRTYPGKRVTVHAPDGSYAAKRAAAELREAERAADALEKLLEPPEDRRGTRVEIYLTDPVLDMAAGMAGVAPSGNGHGAPAGPAADAIVRVV